MRHGTSVPSDKVWIWALETGGPQTVVRVICMSTQDDKLSLLARVARLYYEAEKTQEEIASQLGLSRPSVSRLLRAAREAGVVKIIIREPLSVKVGLEKALTQHFGLKRVIVVASSGESENEVKQKLGEATAGYLADLVRDGDTIGISWGTTMASVAEALIPKAVSGVTVVQLNGAVNLAMASDNAVEIARKFGHAFGAMTYYLPVPAVVDNRVVKDAILSDSNTARILELGGKANIAVFTIGYPNSSSILVESGYFAVDEVMALRERGAVGDICSHYFTVDGTVCDPELDARTIGLELSKLREKAYAIAVAGGIHRAKGIVGAIRGGFMNVLVTDEMAAKEVLRLAGAPSPAEASVNSPST